MKKPSAFNLRRVLLILSLVELRGFEPLTS